MGRWLASAGLSVIAIDGLYHGDRVTAPMAPAAYQQLIVNEGIGKVTARMTADWMDAVSAIAGLGLADAAHVSVFGMSMGARFGLPAAAELGPRLQCAVLGKFGIRQTRPLHPGLRAPGLITTAARAISAPVLSHVQWDDELFPRDGQFELFDALGSTDKLLIARQARTAARTPTTRHPGRTSSGATSYERAVNDRRGNYPDPAHYRRLNPAATHTYPGITMPAAWRHRAITGRLHSDTLVSDPRSDDRTRP